jgi:anthranilate synthase component II
MNIAVIDNYDSFTYNLVHALRKISGLPIRVFLNDEITPEELTGFDKIVLSPGPGIPVEAGNLMKIISELAPLKSMLGVCLGHQAIGEVFGARLLNLNRVFHGIATPVNIISRNTSLFSGIPDTFIAGRYHSWIVDTSDLPDCFEITGVDSDGRIMAMRHRNFDIQGVQFHPESVLTPLGEKMIENWLMNTKP